MNIRVDTRLAEKLVTKSLRQIPFSMSQALNQTAQQFQTEERNTMEGRFTLRRRTWALQSVKITQFAKKEQLEAVVAISPPGAPQRADILSKFEDGGRKRSKTGGSVAVPDDQAFSHARVIPQGKRPKAFQFKAHRTFSGKVQFKGEQRTFIVEKSTFERGIFQRVSKSRGGRGGLRLLYWFTRSVRIPADLRFHATAQAVFKRRFNANFNAALAKNIREAR